MDKVKPDARPETGRDPWRAGRSGLAKLVPFVSLVTAVVLAYRLGRPASDVRRAVWIGGGGLLVLASAAAALVMVFASNRRRSGWLTLAAVALCVAGFALMLGYAFATGSAGGCDGRLPGRARGDTHLLRRAARRRRAGRCRP